MSLVPRPFSMDKIPALREDSAIYGEWATMINFEIQSQGVDHFLTDEPAAGDEIENVLARLTKAVMIKTFPASAT